MFKENHNCCHTFQGQRVQVLIDGNAYFDSLVSALDSAKDTIYIAGWAMDFVAWLKPDAPDGEKLPLEAYIRRLASKTPNLHIYVLVWDMAEAFLWRAAPWVMARRRWIPHPRIHFRYDNAYPSGGSQHQKFVVVDDAVAFIGGLDLTVGRWDTREHLVTDPRRTDARGVQYGPFHDAQCRIETEAALGAAGIFRDRWERLTRKTPLKPRIGTPPPPTGPWVFEQCDVALARTEPMTDPPAREVEKLFIDSFKAARSTIYIENQYLTSRKLGQVLAERLEEEHGPEVVVIGPRQPAGWMEEITIGMLRWRVIFSLRKADKNDRLRICYPMASVKEDVPTYVHIKLTIIDDVFVRIGSANVSTRSLGIDSELDVGFRVTTAAGAAQVRALRASLLAEHLGVTPAQVDEIFSKQARVTDVVDELRGNDRTLVDLDGGPDAGLIALAQDADILLDPEEPVDFFSAAESFIGKRATKRVIENLPFGFMSVAVISLAVTLGRFLMPAKTVELYQTSLVQSQELTTFLGPLEALAVAGLLLAVGLNQFVIIIVLVAMFGGLIGAGVIYGALLLAAGLSYAYGHLLGRNIINKLFGVRVQEVRNFGLSRGAWSVAMIRFTPISRFHTVGAVAGASRMRFRHYIMGTATGVIPNFLLLTLVAYGVRLVLIEPNLWSVLSLFLILFMFGGIVYNAESAWHKWYNRKQGPR